MVCTFIVPCLLLLLLFANICRIIKKLIEKHYVQSTSEIIAVDLKENNSIFNQVLSSTEILNLKREYFDICDFDSLTNVLNEYHPQYIIHLAGLQIPFCRAHPILGAKVNVMGTLTVFECVKEYNSHSSDKILSIVYASSAGVCGPISDYLPNTSVSDLDVHIPRTHYGVYKLCNEGNARIFWQDFNIPSVGLRPLTCYGVGREVGLTSDVTKAVKAAVIGQPFIVKYHGNTLFHFVEDIAELFIRCALRVVVKPGAYQCNIKGNTLSVQQFINIVSSLLPNAKQLISVDENAIVLPFPDSMLQPSLDVLFKGTEKPKITRVEDAIAKIVLHFRRLKNENKLYSNDLISKL